MIQYDDFFSIEMYEHEHRNVEPLLFFDQIWKLDTIDSWAKFHRA